MLGARAGHDRAGGRASRRANRRAGAAAGDPADDRAEPGAAADLARRLLAFARAFRLDVGRDDVVLPSAKRERVRLERDLVGAFHLARLLDLRGLQLDGGASRHDDLAVHHQWIVVQRFEDLYRMW